MNRIGLSLSACLAPWFFACDGALEAPGARTDDEPPAGKADDPKDPGATETVRPDFAPAAGVRAHILLRELAPDFAKSLAELLGPDSHDFEFGHQGPSLGFSGRENLVWARDYLPLRVGRGDAEVVVAYLSVNEVRSAYTGAQWVPVPAPSPDHQFYRSPSGSGGRWIPTETMPLLFEGGNLVSTGRWVITTDRLLHLNTRHSEGTDASHLREAGWRPGSEAQVLDTFSKHMRVPRERVIVIPSMPGEKTDHADLVVMALGSDEVMVPELRDDILGILSYGHEIELGWTVRRYLDEVADQLAERGLRVHRLPMLPPVYLEHDPGEATGWNGAFFSPTNALLLVRLDGERLVWLPSFDAVGFPGDYLAVADSYLEEQARFFEERGFDVQVVDATRLGRAYGLFRCVTSPVFAE